MSMGDYFPVYRIDANLTESSTNTPSNNAKFTYCARRIDRFNGGTSVNMRNEAVGDTCVRVIESTLGRS